MKPKKMNSNQPTPMVFDDDLVRLELKIAQRADQLFERDGHRRGRDLEHWLEAEREVFNNGYRQGQGRTYARP